MAWVVTQQAGGVGLAATLAGAVLLTAAAFAWGRMQRGGAGWRGPAMGALAGCVVVLALVAARAPSAGAMTLAPGAERFTPARLAALRAQHRPVLVDMSAAWCITCLVNERVALSPPAVKAAFARHGVAYLVGDWTRRDPDVTAFLRDYGRNGVPLYVYFPADGAAVVLPQILTVGEVLGHVGT
jgi:thiol:disulfide interchange protein DsbD